MIIVAGGIGTRMNSDIPKQFLLLANEPLIFHTIRAFTRFDQQIQVIVALPENYFSYWSEICTTYNFTQEHTLVKGGVTRFHTVKSALQQVQDDRVVAIHDAVRPLVSQKTIERCFRNALTYGNAIPVIPEDESVRWIDGDKNQPVSRENLRIVQTPQVFEASLIKRAYNRVTTDQYTDDASVLEAMGESIHLVEGNRENIKITNPDELVIAEALFNLNFQ